MQNLKITVSDVLHPQCQSQKTTFVTEQLIE